MNSTLETTEDTNSLQKIFAEEYNRTENQPFRVLVSAIEDQDQSSEDIIAMIGLDKTVYVPILRIIIVRLDSLSDKIDTRVLEKINLLKEKFFPQSFQIVPHEVVKDFAQVASSTELHRNRLFSLLRHPLALVLAGMLGAGSNEVVHNMTAREDIGATASLKLQDLASQLSLEDATFLKEDGARVQVGKSNTQVVNELSQFITTLSPKISQMNAAEKRFVLLEIYQLLKRAKELDASIEDPEGHILPRIAAGAIANDDSLAFILRKLSNENDSAIVDDSIRLLLEELRKIAHSMPNGEMLLTNIYKKEKILLDRQ